MKIIVLFGRLSFTLRQNSEGNISGNHTQNMAPNQENEWRTSKKFSFSLYILVDWSMHDVFTLKSLIPQWTYYQ